jgi:hypothetical protein
MPKRLHQPNGSTFPLGRHTDWSIDSNSLTSAGQSELLKHLGRQLQNDYQDVLKEPAPDSLRKLLERLKERQADTDEEYP